MHLHRISWQTTGMSFQFPESIPDDPGQSGHGQQSEVQFDASGHLFALPVHRLGGQELETDANFVTIYQTRVCTSLEGVVQVPEMNAPQKKAMKILHSWIFPPFHQGQRRRREGDDCWKLPGKGDVAAS